MPILHSIILGIVEGLTEFLPVSSTFHLIITSQLLGLTQDSYVKMFEVVIQTGAISALLFMYLKELFNHPKLAINVFASFIPTAIVGFTLHSVIKTVFFESHWLMLSVFVLVGIIFLWIEHSSRNLSLALDSLTLTQSLIIGLAQSLSVIPGVSRSGSVIVAMMLLGYKRDESAKYTFLLSLPTIFAASALDLYQGRAILAQSYNTSLLLVGYITALIIAYFVVKWFIHYLSNHTLKVFGWYRLILASLLVIFKVLP